MIQTFTHILHLPLYLSTVQRDIYSMELNAVGMSNTAATLAVKSPVAALAL